MTAHPTSGEPPAATHTTERLRREERLGALLGLLGVVLFGLTLPAQRVAVPEMGFVTVGIGRTVLAALPAAVYLWLSGASRPGRAVLPALACVAGGVVFGFPLLSALAMAYAPATHGGVMLGILPLATAAAGVVAAGERPSPGFWLAGAAGSTAVIAFALMQGAGEVHLADLALIAAVAAAAVGYAWSGSLARTMPAGQVIAWALVLSLPLTIPVTALGVWLERPDPGPAAWTGFLYAAFVSQFLAFFLWNRGMALGGVARVGQMQLLQPFVTIAAAALLLGEPLSVPSLAFAAIVVATVAIGRRMRVARPAPTAADRA